MEGVVQREINQCKTHIQLLIDLNDSEGARAWFKELCHTLTNLLVLVKRKLKAASNSATFYFTQLTTYLSLLIPIFSTQDFSKTIQARLYTQKRLTQCLEGVENVFVEGSHSNTSPDENFMSQIDSSLEKLSLIDINDGRTQALSKYQSARKQIVQALCHAMSIAHVGYSRDFQAIKGGCKAVLDALDSLNQELQNVELNIAMCNLSVDSCYDKLCNLERRVNTAVLRLCLKIFSQHDQPLQLLSEFCKRSKGNNEELDGLITDFDLQVDRIMHIGYFAVASSPDNRCRIKMQSHLACLEALESELVPNLKAFKFDKTGSNAHLIVVLERHWLNEVEELKRALYSVIDPFAFSQIAQEELKRSIEVTFERVTSNGGVLKLNWLETFMNEAEAMMDVVSISFGDTEPPIEVKKLLGDLKQVLYEIKAAIQLLLVEQKPDKDGSVRIKKRCTIMLTITKKLVLSLAQENHLKDSSTITNEQSEAPSDNIKSDRIESDNKFLDHIVNKGMEILKERSVLRKTPMKVTFFKDLDKPPASSLKKRSFHFSYSKVRDDSSIDLQLTEILSGISSSFSQVSSNNIDN